MNKPVKVKPIKQTKPDLSKLSRALLMLAEKQIDEAKQTQTKKAS